MTRLEEKKSQVLLKKEREDNDQLLYHYPLFFHIHANSEFSENA